MGAPNRCQGQTAAATRRLQYAGALLLLLFLWEQRQRHSPQQQQQQLQRRPNENLPRCVINLFSSSTTSRGAPTKMRPRFTKEQQQHCGRRRERRSCRRYKYNKVYLTDTHTLWKNNRIHLPYIIECINLCSGIFIECEVKWSSEIGNWELKIRNWNWKMKLRIGNWKLKLEVDNGNTNL